MGTGKIPAPTVQLKALDVAKCAVRSSGYVAGAFFCVWVVGTIIENFTNVLDALAISVWTNILLAAVFVVAGGTTACVAEKMPAGGVARRRISTVGASMQIGTITWLAAISRLPDDSVVGWFPSVMIGISGLAALFVGAFNGDFACQSAQE